MCFLPASRAWRLHPPWGCANCTPTLRLLSLLHLKALQRGRSSSLRNSLSICKSLKLPIPRKMDLDKGWLRSKLCSLFFRLPLHIFFCNRKNRRPLSCPLTLLMMCCLQKELFLQKRWLAAALPPLLWLLFLENDGFSHLLHAFWIFVFESLMSLAFNSYNICIKSWSMYTRCGVHIWTFMVFYTVVVQIWMPRCVVCKYS